MGLNFNAQIGYGISLRYDDVTNHEYLDECYDNGVVECGGHDELLVCNHFILSLDDESCGIEKLSVINRDDNNDRTFCTSIIRLLTGEDPKDDYGLYFLGAVF
jgi:hypothetical protein